MICRFYSLSYSRHSMSEQQIRKEGGDIGVLTLFSLCVCTHTLMFGA